MNEEMYMFLCSNNFLTHGIGEINEKETFVKFESIIKFGGLMSKKKLEENGIVVHGKADDLHYDYRITDKNQISLFDPTLPQLKKRLLSKFYYHYLPFHPNVIFFIIDRSNLSLQQNPTTAFELNENSGFISIENFKGIIAPQNCINYLDEIQKKYGINLPIYDFNFSISSNLENDISKKI